MTRDRGVNVTRRLPGRRAGSKVGEGRLLSQVRRPGLRPAAPAKEPTTHAH